MFAPRLRPTTLPSGATFSHPPPVPLPSEQTGATASTVAKTPTLFQQFRHPFINASGCLNPELGQLVEYDAYRRWQARMTSHRRDGEYNRAYNHKENSRHRSGQSRGYHREQGQIISPNSNPGNLYTSGHHGGVPPSPASSAPALVPGMSCGVAYNPI